MTMRLGKLDNDRLEELVLNKFRSTRPEALSAPEIGRDCAVLNLGGDLAVLSCDPITSASVSQLGRLSVHVNCNDAAAAGAEPVGLLVTLLAPPDAEEAQIGAIADDLAQAARDANVDILGGHTEVTDSVTRFVTCTSVVARMPKENALTGIRPGNDIVMTKWAGLEGTMLIADSFPERLSQLDAETLKIVEAFSSLLSVVPESRIAMQHGVTAMHDVTEGGILGAVWEMAYESGCGAVIDPASIPILPETLSVTKAAGVDPLRLISSGSMLISCHDGQRMVDALQKAEIHAACIGCATVEGILLADGTPIDPPGADEIYRLYRRN